MQLQTHLVHAEAGRRVVLASAWEAGQCLGSALGEATSAEEAEDRAIERLRGRIRVPGGPGDPGSEPETPPGAAVPKRSSRPPSLPTPPGTSVGAGTTTAPAGRRSGPEPAPASASPLPPRLQSPVATPALPEPADPAITTSGPAGAGPAVPPGVLPSPPLPANALAAARAPEPPPDPEDWSDELAGLELELQRLGWGREQEAAYLERAFGHPNRGRLTRYADLTAYLGVLRRASAGADPAALPTPLRRRDLLEQSDLLLGQLHWDAAQGRAFLERHFALSSRQLLSDEQLLHFNLLLEEEASAPVSTCSPPAIPPHQ
ncbi:hypothetical protein [Cyanobium sp. Morenito 9A2]|uniref:hypothetical protein n=1 Tax=Cyanobium sp. Morenito 9A2 TaxID=2823718 RepID=UPI0020CBAC66|nr:hypothetical protein [Cyanobium sp. Morenito 9A2]MCP9848696.1 hypothetical protein [Cyanobium sp. Morenito 9A2]